MLLALPSLLKGHFMAIKWTWEMVGLNVGMMAGDGQERAPPTAPQ